MAWEGPRTRPRNTDWHRGPLPSLRNRRCNTRSRAGPGRVGSGRALCDSDEPIRRRLRASSRVTFSFRSFSLPRTPPSNAPTRPGVKENRKLRAHLHGSLLIIPRGTRKQKMAFLLTMFLSSIAHTRCIGECASVANNGNCYRRYSSMSLFIR